MYGTPVAWKSQRQTVRSDSTCASEYIALSDGIAWAEVWGHLPFFIWRLRDRDTSLAGLPPRTLIWTDSASAKDVAESDMQKPKARYLVIRWHRVRDAAPLLRFCKTDRQRADCLTKPPTSASISSMLSWHGMCPIERIDEMRTPVSVKRADLG